MLVLDLGCFSPGFSAAALPSHKLWIGSLVRWLPSWLRVQDLVRNFESEIVGISAIQLPSELWGEQHLRCQYT